MKKRIGNNQHIKESLEIIEKVTKYNETNSGIYKSTRALSLSKSEIILNIYFLIDNIKYANNDRFIYNNRSLYESLYEIKTNVENYYLDISEDEIPKDKIQNYQYGKSIFDEEKEAGIIKNCLNSISWRNESQWQDWIGIFGEESESGIICLNKLNEIIDHKNKLKLKEEAENEILIEQKKKSKKRVKIVIYEIVIHIILFASLINETTRLVYIFSLILVSLYMFYLKYKDKSINVIEYIKNEGIFFLLCIIALKYKNVAYSVIITNIISIQIERFTIVKSAQFQKYRNIVQNVIIALSLLIAHIVYN